ncbi:MULTISPECIES: carboxylesterase family protein [Tsukamurella]|uniref:Carboxylic ester hydrolase n=2 Tax=Tsukamurella TaxID=2060 RepID=A0A5C5RWL8_9ACTN|nr:MULTISPECIES: carboxylesterase family protein [Tsukamurella]NMD54767.1 carboxylesterase/lipase family protein [Tsukamurella columbiensis]TWS27092.1 carboxylesterase/lipase family protein [Tsukamurella conjunctivitidis]
MPSAIVRTDAGAVRGVVADGVAAYRGVPYAASPVGPLRFAAPVRAPSWTGERDASTAGPAAPQGPSRLEAVMGRRTPDWDEDGCLTVNVWAPADASGLPVLLWFHGGGFTSGSGGWDWYDGARLAAAGGIVVVTANYRLGPLGFLYVPLPDADNLGLRDQASALDWVSRNIAAFGGDPTRITVGGQSAGAYSALHLALSPTTAPLVHRVLAQSGPFGLAPQDLDEATARAERFLGLAGVDEPTALRALPAARLLAAYAALAAETAVPEDLAPPMYPVLGGFGTEVPWREGLPALQGKPLMIGTVRDEMTAFVASDPRIDRRDPARERARGEAVFAADSREIADRHSSAGNAVYAYRFDRSPGDDPKRLGATHCAELPFVFDALGAYANAPMLGPVDDRDRELARRLCRAVAGFVATGSPADGGWTAYRPGDPATVRVLDRA